MAAAEARCNGPVGPHGHRADAYVGHLLDENDRPHSSVPLSDRSVLAGLLSIEIGLSERASQSSSSDSPPCSLEPKVASNPAASEAIS